MTRWARVGNSQKHEKLPEDATPWKDFWQNRIPNSADGANRNKVKSGRIEKRKQKQKKKFGFDVKREVFEETERKNIPEQKKYESNDTSTSILEEKQEMNEEHLPSEFQGLSKKQLKRAKKKAKLQQLKIEESNNVPCINISNVADSTEVSQQEENESNHISPNVFSKGKTNAEHSNSEFQGLSKKQLKKAKLKAKLQQLGNTESKDVQDNNSSNDAESTELSQMDDKSPKEKDFQGKKKLFMKKLEQKRKQNGILLLPAKVERKLYIIKKRLREKGLPPAAIKDIIRKERRKEELKFRRTTMSTKPCFNCRQTGHLLAECPMKLGNSNQETGLCFKCGSAEHTSYKCPKKIKGYPLAKCFVCKEQGHISKDCPQNEHGVYIKGGKCSLCGNVNHLKKDCPTLKKKNDEEADITAYTINADKSIDAEIIPTDDVKTDVRKSVKKEKKAKLVKF